MKGPHPKILHSCLLSFLSWRWGGESTIFISFFLPLLFMWVHFSYCPTCIPFPLQGAVFWFCLLTALLRAGGRAKGRVGLRSNRWLDAGVGVLKANSLGNDCRTNETACVFTCLWRVAVAFSWRCLCFMVSEAATHVTVCASHIHSPN